MRSSVSRRRGDEAVQAFGGVGADGQQPNVINAAQIGAQDAADGFGDGVISAVSAHQRPESFEAKPNAT
jgi:hypothetical protein